MKEVIIEVATSCPNRCLHCSSECGWVDDSTILFEEFKTLVSAAAAVKFDRIVFSGGEPLAFAPLPEFIAHAKAEGFLTKIYTSGCGDRGVIDALLRADGRSRPDSVVLSCYGPTPEINTAITGNEDFFRNLCSMLRLARACGIEAALNFVPMKINYRSLRQTYDMFADSIASFNVLRLVRQGNAVDNWNDIHVADALLQPVLREMAGRDKFNPGRSFQSDALPTDKICEAGAKKICISSDGFILPCEVFKQNRFEFENIHTAEPEELRAIFGKFSSIRARSEGVQGCLKKEIHRLSLGGA